jgi:hypothetical protein
MVMSENQLSQPQVHVTAIHGIGDLVVKASLNRLPSASMFGGGGLGSHPTPRHVIANLHGGQCMTRDGSSG